MADEAGNREAFRIQAYYCRQMDAPVYAHLCDAIADGLTRVSETGRRVLDWPGEPTRDALPLRLVGGLHALVLAGRDAGLAAVFDGSVDDREAIAAVVDAVLVRENAALLPWLDGPPQTNEPGRSAALMTGLMEVARALGPKLELLEIGSSAGLNLLIDRYRFDLGGTLLGPANAPVTLRPAWRGAAPAAVPLEIVSVRGCDIRPLDATDPAVEARLTAYVWAEAPERMARLRAAVAMLRERGVRLDAADAADWVEARLAEPQPAGVTRVLMHSVVWQYLPRESADRIRAAMARAGAAATADRPLAWVVMEPDRATAQMLVRVRCWPGEDAWQVVASAHAHGAWIEPGAPAGAGDWIALPDAARAGVG
ncbi:hypothetical protein GCM10011380_16950 [Sphingomonas metalli]|uniref:DUF2332 domain-containing protein n=1 Tax=Sphingomonas metalli TaxID=1779358 RepID=A0A916WT36_9SPHN|nr:DUF2332 domain-containing protein [Sphingomonas metalli]GGB27946.1 hypothetical protein GCM10011380_16950 [Sphingomonas metalli]